nr:formyltransferase family protein [Marivibrio halodurans]
MRVGILTTETPHHVRFVQAIAARHDVVRVFEERREISADFETHHPFEDERAVFERATWFDGADPGLSDVAEVETHRDLNDPKAVASMKAAGLDALLVFGTGRLNQNVIDVAPERIVNLHGANPEKYRGLDTHLWAVYHGDFRGLVTTLHRVAPELDRGGVVMRMPIPIHRGMKLHQLRKANTDVCIDISLQGLEMLANYGQFISQPQLYIGRYYSFMPAVLKSRCVRQFEAFTAAL